MGATAGAHELAGNRAPFNAGGCANGSAAARTGRRAEASAARHAAASELADLPASLRYIAYWRPVAVMRSSLRHPGGREVATGVDTLRSVVGAATGADALRRAVGAASAIGVALAVGVGCADSSRLASISANRSSSPYSGKLETCMDATSCSHARSSNSAYACRLKRAYIMRDCDVFQRRQA